MNNWKNLTFLIGGLIFIVFVFFGIYLFYKIYSIKDIVYCVYDDRDIYENLVIGSKDECEEWINCYYFTLNNEKHNPEEKAHYHVTLYFNWSFKAKRKHS